MVIKLQLSVFMIAGSYCDFCLLQATCGRLAVDITPHTRLEGSLLGTECFRDYIVSMRVSLRFRFWHAVGPGKKRKKHGIKQHPTIYSK